MKHSVITGSFIESIPHRPGVYIMKDDTGQTLYVGKARDLKKRLSSYSRSDIDGFGKTSVMLRKVSRIETILTNTEKEALILEASLIKKDKPRYNVILRDDKNYPYLKVTVNEDWPRVIVSRRRIKDGSRYFGPFSSASAMRDALNYLNHLFPLRRCKGKSLEKRPRPCLYSQMNRCPAPCTEKADRERYFNNVRNVLMALEGRNHELIKELEARMKEAADELNFEEAALLRDRISALRATLEKQIMVAPHFMDQDIFGFARKGTAVSICVLLVRSGAVSGQHSYFFPETAGLDSDILAQIVAQYYGEDRPLPHEILLPFEIVEMDLISEWLNDLKGTRVNLKLPKRGLGLRLLNTAINNACQIHEDMEKKARSWSALEAAMKRELRLTCTPYHIECIDISNIGAEAAVGSLVCFKGGEADKDNYRHYKIRSVQKPDDCGMMEEVLNRHLARVVEQDRFPDLLVVDGGKGQLNVAVRTLEILGLGQTMDLVAIAKEGMESGEKLYRPGRKNPILLKGHDPVLLFLMRVRDESHRYGITFHRKIRRKHATKSILDQIPGLGPVKKTALLNTLGSIRKIEKASIEELMSVKGIGADLGAKIQGFFTGK